MAKAIFLITWGFLLMCAGCTVDPNESDTLHTRIVFGESIANIHLGDDLATVVEKLGQPNEVLPSDGGWVGYEYTQGDYAGLKIVIYIESDGVGTGVRHMGAHPPFKGKSEAGIGLDSSREMVLGVLGEPATSVEGEHPGKLADSYLFDATRFEIVYTENRITLIMVYLR